MFDSPNGAAPLYGDVQAQSVPDLKYDAYETCDTHGLVHKSTRPCQMCYSASKSITACTGCGTDLAKMAGGGMICKKCNGLQ